MGIVERHWRILVYQVATLLLWIVLLYPASDDVDSGILVDTLGSAVAFVFIYAVAGAIILHALGFVF